MQTTLCNLLAEGVFGDGSHETTKLMLANLPPHEVRALLDQAGETMTEDGVLIVSFPAGTFQQDCRRPLREWEILAERNGEEWDVFTLRRIR